jgi:hypothetical protein
MGCLIVLIGLFSPRLAIIVLALFTNLMDRAYDGFLVPVLGFLLVPWTTFMYALVYSSGDRVYGFEWFLVGIAFVLDLGSYAGSDKFRRDR